MSSEECHPIELSWCKSRAGWATRTLARPADRRAPPGRSRYALGEAALGRRITVDEQATRAIIERARAGDGEAFAALFREYDRDVRRVCRRMLGDSQSTEDAVSEVFLRSHRALEGFKSDRPFRPWLIAIAGHYCIDQLRRRTSEARVFSENEPRSRIWNHPGRLLLAAWWRPSSGRRWRARSNRYPFGIGSRSCSGTSTTWTTRRSRSPSE